MFGPSRKMIQEAMEGVMQQSLNDVHSFFSKARSLHKLQEEISVLKIDKSYLTEEFARERRELEHKIGLERIRQEQELTNSKREAVLDVREENLVKDRARFEDQLAMHDKLFTEQVSYLKDMVGQVLAQLPTAELFVHKDG